MASFRLGNLPLTGLNVLDTNFARKLAAHSNSGQDSNKAMAFSDQNSFQASKFCSTIRLCSREVTDQLSYILYG